MVVRNLAEELNASLSAGIDPGIIVERVSSSGRAATAANTVPPTLRLVISGSSHMSRTIPHITAKGVEVTDLTERNWHLIAKSASSLVAKIQETESDPLKVFVHDLFGNTSVRFQKADDTLSLAVKLSGEGGWHLLGDAVYTPDGVVREQVRLLGSLETCLKGRAKIFIPPIPRFVFGSCCGNESHAQNTHTSTHPAHAIMEHTRQRHTIIKSLNSIGMTHHRVIDVMQNLNTDTDSQQNRIKSLKKYTHGDNIHLTVPGYSKLAENIVAAATAMTSSRTPVPNSITKGLERTSWRGFIITTSYGAALRHHPDTNSRGRGGRHHPYRR